MGSRLFTCLVYVFLLNAGLLLSIWGFNNKPLNLETIQSLYSVWDGPHYLYLAQHGYQVSGDSANFIVFLPLYPALIALLQVLIGSYFWSALLVSNLGTLFGFYFTFRAFENIGLNKTTILATLTLLTLSPPSLYLTIVYTEGLYFALTSAFFFLLTEKRYWPAALMGGLSALTRQTGLLTLLPLAIVYLAELKTKKISFAYLSKGVGLAALVAGLYSVYLCINWSLWGDPFYFRIPLKENWQKETLNPFSQYLHHASHLAWPQSLDLATRFIDKISLLVFPILMLAYRIWGRAKIPLAWMAWLVVCWLTFCSQSYWLSSARYMMLIFVFPLMLVSLTEGRRWLRSLAYLILTIGTLVTWQRFATNSWVF